MTAITLYEDPRSMEAVRLYTDPLLPTFGNKRASATQAGTSVTVFKRTEVQKEIDRIIVQRMEQSENTVEFLGTYAMDAAKELIGQLSAGRDLEFIDMETTYLASTEASGKRLASIVRHNAMVLQAYEQRRKAAVEIIRQQIGTPEQRIVVDKGGNEELPQLTDLEDDQLEELGSFISNALAERKLEAEEVEEADWSEGSPTEEEIPVGSSRSGCSPGSPEPQP